MLPEAEIAFLDEVFLGSTAILNTLLGILNERRFRRGHTVLDCPLRVCVGAANRLPEDDALAAFADRFLLRYFAEPVADPELEALLEGGWALHPVEPSPVGLEAIDVVARTARAAELAPIRPALGQALRTLRREGISLTDRRLVKSQRLIAAAAALGGRHRPTEADLWPLVYIVPDAAGQRAAKEALRAQLAPGDNAALPAAAEEATAGPAARARRLTEAAEALLAAASDLGLDASTRADLGPDASAHADDRAQWTLKAEGILREIDASLAPNDRPTPLSDARTRLIQNLQLDPDFAGLESSDA